MSRVNGNLNLLRAIEDLRYMVCSHLFSICYINTASLPTAPQSNKSQPLFLCLEKQSHCHLKGDMCDLSDSWECRAMWRWRWISRQ